MIPGIVAAAGAVTLPVVTGGTLTSDATYYYRTFTANSNLVVSGAPLTVEMLMYGGGGAGDTSTNGSGQYDGCGGGAGSWLRVITGINATEGTYSVVIGAGGNYDHGTNSTALGYVSGRGLAGFSGGGNTGGYMMDQNGNGQGTPGNRDYNVGGGGGGGAGFGGAGGNGYDAGYQSGIGGAGGAGSLQWGATRCAGGRGGNGAYASGTFFRNGTANVGEGGSGRNATYFGNYESGQGGSGIVIVRYLRTAVGG